MMGFTEQHIAVLTGKPAHLGPRKSLVMGYTVVVVGATFNPGPEVGRELPPLALKWTSDSPLKQAERVLASKGWRMAGDWSRTAESQHFLEGDYGNWTAPVVPIDDHIRRAGVSMVGQDLAGRDFTAMIFSGADLNGADLTRANLTRADLSGADLTRAKLTGAVLHSANLTGANLTGADLTGADLIGAKFTEANLSDADLSKVSRDGNTTFSGARMVRAKAAGLRILYMENVDLTGADLTNANLRQATMSHTCLRDATLVGADFYRAELLGTDLKGAALPDLDAMAHVTWNEKTTWDPAHEAEIRRRSSETKPASFPKAPRSRQPRGFFARLRRQGSEPREMVRQWIVNPLPLREFEQAVVEYFVQLRTDRREVGKSGYEFLWATVEEATTGVGESMGRAVPESAVRSFLTGHASGNKRPPYTLFDKGDDGRYKINPGVNWRGHSVFKLIR